MDNLSSSPGSSGDEASVTNETNTANMTRRPNPSGRGPPPPKRIDIDLGAILSIDQKLQLQQLMANTLDTMQKSLRDTFDLMGQGRDASGEGIKPPTAVSCTTPNPRSAKYAHMYGLTPLTPDTGPKDDPEKEKEKEKDGKPVQKEIAKAVPAAASAPTYSPTLLALAGEGILKIPKSIAEASAMSRKDENDALTASMLELKRDALTYFGKWRGSVVRRLGEIIIKDGGNAGNVMKPAQLLAQGNNARRPGSAGRGRPQRPVSGPGDEANNRFPTSVPLCEMPKEKRLCILHSMLLLLLGLESYQTHSRVLLFHLASALSVPLGVLAQDEVRLAKSLAQIVKDISQEEITRKRAEEGRTSRRWKGAAGAVASNGPTGVLAAPLASAGVGTVFGGLGFSTTIAAGLLGTMAESTVVVGNLFGLYGARATSKMGDAYVKEVQDFALIPLHGTLGKELVDPQDLPAEDRRLRFTVGISGWLEHKEDTKKAWTALGPQTEAYALRWELDTLTKMNTALEIILKSVSWTMAKQEMRERSVFDSLKTSLWPMDLIKISKVVDNPWTVGMVRAEKAGGILADAILNKFQGERSITLIGYGLGARVIYACLMQLSEKRVFGAIENAVMLGTPCPTEVRSWTAMRSVVAGRLVNVHSKNDYLLGFMYRTGSWQYGIAGLEKIQGVHGVENLDVSDLATNHIRYQHLVNIVLKKLNWEDVGNAGVIRDEDALRRLDAEEALLDEARCARSLEQGLQTMGMNAQDADRKSKPTMGKGAHKAKDNSNRRTGGKQGK